MSGNRNDMAWKVLKRDIVFQDTWVQLEASRCELPDGRIIEPFYIRRDPDFAVVVALTKDDRLVLVRQYRHGVEKVLLELPAGAIEKGEDPKVAAGRELLEETGYQAGPSGVFDENSAECGQFHRICVLLSRDGC